MAVRLSICVAPQGRWLHPKCGRQHPLAQSGMAPVPQVFAFDELVPQIELPEVTPAPSREGPRRSRVKANFVRQSGRGTVRLELPSELTPQDVHSMLATMRSTLR